MVGLTPWVWVGALYRAWTQAIRHARSSMSPIRTLRDHKVPLLGTQCGLERGQRAGSKLGRELSSLRAFGSEMCGVTYILFPWPKNCAWENWKGWPRIHVKGVSRGMVTGPHHMYMMPRAFSEDLHFHYNLTKPGEVNRTENCSVSVAYPRSLD